MVNLYQLLFGTVAGICAGIACGGGAGVHMPWCMSIEGETHRRWQWWHVDGSSGGDRRETSGGGSGT